MVQSRICEELKERSCRHCAALFIVPDQFPWEPTINDPSATITFIKMAGRTFGITTSQIVQTLDALNEDPANGVGYTFLTALERPHVISNRIKAPQTDWTKPVPELAIRELAARFPTDVGKIALDIEAHPPAPAGEETTAMAVGFPDRAKRLEAAPLGYRLLLPCVRTIAENVNKQGQSLSLLSRLEGTSEVRSLCGMSGGPIYWSDAEKFGLLGITYEASRETASVHGANALDITGRVADRAALERWTASARLLY
jgi:hypothetical protein